MARAKKTVKKTEEIQIVSMSEFVEETKDIDLYKPIEKELNNDNENKKKSDDNINIVDDMAIDEKLQEGSENSTICVESENDPISSKEEINTENNETEINTEVIEVENVGVVIEEPEPIMIHRKPSPVVEHIPFDSVRWGHSVPTTPSTSDIQLRFKEAALRPYELRYKGQKIYDSKIDVKVSVVFDVNVIIITVDNLTHKYPYDALRIINK